MTGRDSMTRRRLGIVADDLTGAMDSSGYFAELGLSTIVVLDPDTCPEGDVVVIPTDSRTEEPSVAAEKVRRAARRLTGRIVYKKIDSTLRGNIGVELVAAMDALGCAKAVVAPAFPVVGRTTVQGNLLVNGVKVAETQFANDPTWPVRESHIPTLLERTAGRQVGLVTVKGVEAGPHALYNDIEGRPESIVVCDVTVQAHLDTIARAVGMAGARWMPCGSGGLARAMNLLMAGERKQPRTAADGAATGPALIVVGTRNQVAAAQLRKARETTGLPVLDLNVEALEESGAGEVDRLVREAAMVLGSGRSVAVTTAFSQYLPALKGSIPVALGRVVTGVLRTVRPAGLFLSGGDIASQVCQALSVSAIRVYGEVEPGVPAGEVVGGPAGAMRVVTKAGGFGTDAVLAKAISYIEKGHLA